MNRRLIGAGIIFFAFTAAATAQVASPPPEGAPPSEAAREQARRDVAAGQQLLKRGEPEAALARFDAAVAAAPTTAAWLGLAEAQRRTDRVPEAYRSYERLLAERAGELFPEERDAVQQALAELGAATGTVKLAAVDAQASYAIDGRPAGADLTGRPLHLSAGRHVLGATRPGFEPLTFPIWVTVGKELVTSLVLKPDKSAPPPPVSVAPPPAPVAPPPAAPSIPAPVVPPAPPAAPPAAPPPAAPPVPPAPAPAPPLPVSSTPVAPPPEPLAPIQPLGPAAPLPPASAPPLPAPPPEPAPVVQGPPPNPFTEGTHVGLVLGILALPRPVEGEIIVKAGPTLALSLQGSFLPELSVPGVDAKLDLKAVQGILRWFPSDGVFFIGGGLGYQSFQASIGDSIDNGELTITADMSGFFIAPQLGVLWVSSSGLALSFGIGLQIPLPKDPVVSATFNGQPVPDQATASVPQAVVDEAHSDKDNVQSVARFIVKYPFPTIDLLRIGLFF